MNIFHIFSSVSIDEFEQVYFSWHYVMKILRKVYQSDYVRDKIGTGQPRLCQRLPNTYFKIQVIYNKVVYSIGVISKSVNQYTAHKMKFSIKDFFSKCDQIHRKLRIWSHLLKKSLMENFVFGAVLALIWKISIECFSCLNIKLSDYKFSCTINRGFSKNLIKHMP